MSTKTLPPQLDAIRASHIKPWRDSTDEERLDPSNGLPLVASLDALFDAGLISFEESGRMLVSPSLQMAEKNIFGLVGKALTLVLLERHSQRSQIKILQDICSITVRTYSNRETESHPDREYAFLILVGECGAAGWLNR